MKIDTYLEPMTSAALYEASVTLHPVALAEQTRGAKAPWSKRTLAAIRYEIERRQR